MPLQDLTPQLRTRLNRMERAVGWFITLATLLLMAGFGYYIYNTAEARGWFKTKARYYTYTDNGSGLKVGDSVKLMGKDVGQILEITPMAPTWGHLSTNNFYILFDVTEPNFGYIWTEGSSVQVKSSGLLNDRVLNISKGTIGYATYITQPFRDDLTLEEAAALPNLDKWHLGEEVYTGTNLEFPAWQPLTKILNETNRSKITAWLGTNRLHAIDTSNRGKSITAMWNQTTHQYDRYKKTNSYELERDEEPALTDRLQAMVAQIQAALPGVLQLTNQIAMTLSNVTSLTSNLNIIAENARPAVSNFAIISGQLTNGNGSLGDWLIPTNTRVKIDAALESANGTLTNVDTDLGTLNMTLTNVANITSNLNNQVQANTNILRNISDIVVHTDEFIQGLKRFWLFHHLFATKATNATPAHPKQILVSPKQRGQ